MTDVKRTLWLLRWRARLSDTPFSLCLALALVPLGVTAALFGSEVSKAITNVLDGELIPHLWGVELFVSGAVTLLGIGRNSWLGEYVGLQLMAAGMAFYSACCYLGLGLGGIVSGTLAFAYAAACLYRSKILYDRAKENAQAHHNAEADGPVWGEQEPDE